MGYFIVKYDDVKQMVRVAREMEMPVYIDRREPFQRVWFAINQEGLISVHEFTGQADEIKMACFEQEIKPIYADYEYVR